ncbi:MAG TPA: histidine--tRNA ligase [Acidimicrobiia bacterium]|nr:histidine--tRNA ligase [Acidimicrobiia bacterium]
MTPAAGTADAARPDDPSRYRAPIGTHDVLPPESGDWIEVVRAFGARAARYGFDLVLTPVFEHLEVFQRVGESTDVVRKEMYDFEDKGGRRIALRPDGTAPVVRSFVQHRPPVPWNVWYVAPHFRYERPQKGRYRQFWQLGVESLGADDPELDVEVIALAHGFYRDLGLKRFVLQLNSMGDAGTRGRYADALRGYYSEHGVAFGPEFQERVAQNPLRLFDAKRDDWSPVIENAPQITEYLSDVAEAHFERVQEGLHALGIKFEIDPRLVRGLDYYTRTTFEFQSESIDSAQNAIGGGGRYDLLVEEMGGPPTPAIGFAIGVDRVLLACAAEGVLTDIEPHADVFVVNGLGATASLHVTLLATELRENGLRVERAYGDRSVKAQWKAADKSGAAYGVMLGKAEAERDAVAVKDLQSGEQVEVAREALVAWLRERHETVASR